MRESNNPKTHFFFIAASQTTRFFTGVRLKQPDYLADFAYFLITFIRSAS